jgi:uroporphyrinogen-III synthase
MSSARPSLLLTRPMAQSLRFEAAFRKRFGGGWHVVVSPLTELVFLSPDIRLQDIRFLIFTSETAVAAFARLTDRRDLRAFCVGPRTMAVARDAGFDVRGGDGDGSDLADRIIASDERGPFLHVRGAHVAGKVAHRLISAGLLVNEVIAYDQPPVSLSHDAITMLAQTVRVLLPLFSPRAAELAVLGINNPKASLLIATISDTVARAAEGLGSRSIEVAQRPDAGAMLDALGRLMSSIESDKPAAMNGLST